MVLRPRLSVRLNEGLQRKLTLISAPAGFGKTTLVSQWVAGCGRPAAWLSLDEGDNDPARFLAYLVAALQTLVLSEAERPAATIGVGVLGALQSPQPPPPEVILTALLNDITTLPAPFILILDDYHVIDAKPGDASAPVDAALTFLLDHLPPQMHLVITTREDPDLPLARLRARGQLVELRAADLRFTLSEAAEFLNPVMGLNLSVENIAALESRTEGWIAGLQLSALALQGTLSNQGQDAARFVQSFTGSHRFVMDYLVEEVLHQQPEAIQTFLLRTSILNRMCGSLCDAVLLMSTSGQDTLIELERANLFLIPLDDERRWYRYHHLFADLLRQRLHQKEGNDLNELHIRASQWYEHNGLAIEAFHHAAAANDIERAERLIDSGGIPLHLRGVVTRIVDWLASLPRPVMDARPSLWWRYGAMQLVIGQTTGVEEILNSAENALNASFREAEPDAATRYLIGRIAAARAVLALTRYQAETMIVQSRRALKYLNAQNVSLRANAYWTLGVAHLYQKDYAAARQALTEAISLSRPSGNVFVTILATVGLGNVQEAESQLPQAAETYRLILQMAGDQPLQIIYEAHLGMARILYEWNDLDAAEQYARQSIHLARQYDRVIDRFIVCEVFLARVKLAQGDVTGAAAILAQADQTARQQNFVFRLPEIAAARVDLLLRQGNLTAAAQLAQAYDLPLSRARVALAQGDPPAALAGLEPFLHQAEAKGWADERLRGMVLQAVALQAQGEPDRARQRLGDALILAEPGGFIRIFVDEGWPMSQLLARLTAEGGMLRVKEYIHKLLNAFGEPKERQPLAPNPQPLIEPLSQRELEILRLIAEGLSNEEIGERLYLALSTVKGHNRVIFDKLHVQRRTEAVARARELGLI